MTFFCFLFLCKISREAENMSIIVIFHLDLQSLAKNTGASILASLKAILVYLHLYLNRNGNLF